MSGRSASKAENDFSSISSLAVGPPTFLIPHPPQHSTLWHPVLQHQLCIEEV